MKLRRSFNPEAKLAESKTHRLRIENYPCPQCSNHNLKVLLLEEGVKGWEARISCDRCGGRYVVNDTGFHMDFTQGEKQK